VTDRAGSTCIVAHRGAHDPAVENTLPAFERAIALGADMVEFDVRRSSDGALVVHHDSSVRVGESELAVGELTHRDLCRAVGFHVPTLEEVLDLCSGRIGLDIELKEAGFEDEVVRAVRGRYGPDRVIITSFLDEALAAVRDIARDIRTGLLVYAATPPGPAGLDALLGRLGRLKAHALAPGQTMVDKTLVETLNRRDIPVYVWTVNDPRMMTRLLGLGVHGLITDRVEEALQARAGAD